MASSVVVSIGADVSGLTSGMAEAVKGLDSVTASAAKMAASVMASGESAQATATALKGFGFSAAEVSAAMNALGVSQEEFAATTAASTAALGGFERAAAMAGGRIVGMEAGLGMAGSALARVAAYLPGLGELFVIALPVALVGLFADKVYNAYENVVLLKSSIEALSKAGEAEADKAASLNYEYEISAARVAENSKQFDLARQLYTKAASDKPLSLPQINDKEFKQFSSDFVSFMQSVHTGAEAPTVIARINEEAKATQAQLDGVTRQIADIQSGQSIVPLTVFQNFEAQATDLQKKLDLLHGAIGEIQSQTGIAANELAEQLTPIGKTAEKYSELMEKMASEDVAISLKQAQEELKFLNDLAESEDKLTEENLKQMAASFENKDAMEAAKIVAQQMEGQQKLLAQAEKDATTASIQQANEVIAGARAQQDALRERREAIAGENVGPFAKMAGTAEDIRQLSELGPEINKIKVEMNDLSIAKSHLADKPFLTSEEKDQVNQLTEKYRQLQEVLSRLQAQYGELQVKVGTASQTFQKTAQTAFDGINQSVIKFLETGKSFGRDMQEVWNQLASTVIENLMRMAEQMIINLILQKALTTGIAGATGGIGGIFKGLLGFAEGGIVPGAGGQAVPIIAHGGEMVLPQNITNYVMARAGTPNSSSSGTANLHLHTSVNALDSSGFKGVMESNAHTLGRIAQNYLRRRA